MSLTTEIANLTGQVTNLTDRVDGWISDADAKIAQALATVPELAVTIYVDQINGDDTAAGSEAAPLASLGAAFQRVGPTRLGMIRLMSDYTIQQAREYTQHNTALNIIGHGQRRRLVLGLHPATDASADYEVGGLMTGGRYGASVIGFTDMEIVWPSAPASGTLMHERYNSLVSCFYQSGPPLTSLELCRCLLSYPADGVGCVLGADTRTVALAVKSSTYDASRMAGHWIVGIAAGTQTTSVPQVISNLDSL